MCWRAGGRLVAGRGKSPQRTHDNIAGVQDLAPNLSTPTLVAPLPLWPGAKRVTELAIAGVREDPPIAVGFDFPDGSSMCVEYVTKQLHELPAGGVEALGALPWLSVLVLDRGVGLRTVLGMTKRVRAHDAERALAEMRDLFGEEPPVVITQGIDPRSSRRRYLWKVDA